MSTENRPIVKLLAAMREKAEKDLISDNSNLRSTAQKTITPITTRKKRGRPSKRHVTDPARMSEMTAQLRAEACNEDLLKVYTVTKPKMKRKQWNLEDKCRILKLCSQMKKRADVVRHLQNHPKYLGRYKDIRESTVRTIESQGKSIYSGCKTESGRRTVLSDATMENIRSRILQCVDPDTPRKFLVNSVSLRPVILGEIRKSGEYEKIESGDFACSKSWINSLCRSMGLSMRVPTKRGRKLPVDWQEQGVIFLHRLAYLVKVKKLHKEDVFNFDQTGCQLRPHANGGKTRARTGSKDVTVEDHDDKRLITLVPTINAAGEKLPLQLIFKGTEGTNRSIPDYKSGFSTLKLRCPGWQFTQTRNHWSTVQTNLQLIKQIIIPFANESKSRRIADGMTVSPKILIILDCWTVHKDKAFLEKLKKECPNVILLFVPPDLTSKYQPLDVSINGSLKLKLKNIYAEWAGEQMLKEFQNGSDIYECLSVMEEKSLLIEWVRQAWMQIKASEVMSAWSLSNLSEAWNCDIQDHASSIVTDLFPQKDTSGIKAVTGDNITMVDYHVLPLGKDCPLSTSDVQDMEVADDDPFDQGNTDFEDKDIGGQHHQNDEINCTIDIELIEWRLRSATIRESGQEGGSHLMASGRESRIPAKLSQCYTFL